MDSCWTENFAANRFRVRSIGPAAYLTISEVADVFKSTAAKKPEKNEPKEIVVPAEPEKPAADSEA